MENTKIKTANYFPVLTNNYNSTLALEIRMNYGWEGYGIYFAILQKLASEESRSIELKLIKAVAFDFHCNITEIQPIVEGYFTSVDGYFWSEELNKSLSWYDEKYNKNSCGGKKTQSKFTPEEKSANGKHLAELKKIKKENEQNTNSNEVLRNNNTEYSVDSSLPDTNNRIEKNRIEENINKIEKEEKRTEQEKIEKEKKEKNLKENFSESFDSYLPEIDDLDSCISVSEVKQKAEDNLFVLIYQKINKEVFHNIELKFKEKYPDKYESHMSNILFNYAYYILINHNDINIENINDYFNDDLKLIDTDLKFYNYKLVDEFQKNKTNRNNILSKLYF